jgi:outer membrane protein OmpA-like peptidoglycan-associated protein
LSVTAGPGQRARRTCAYRRSLTLSDAGDVLFAFNESDPTPAAQSELDSLMGKLHINR